MIASYNHVFAEHMWSIFYIFTIVILFSFQRSRHWGLERWSGFPKCIQRETNKLEWKKKDILTPGPVLFPIFKSLASQWHFLFPQSTSNPLKSCHNIKCDSSILDFRCLAFKLALVSFRTMIFQKLPFCWHLYECLDRWIVFNLIKRLQSGSKRLGSAWVPPEISQSLAL